MASNCICHSYICSCVQLLELETHTHALSVGYQHFVISNDLLIVVLECFVNIAHEEILEGNLITTCFMFTLYLALLSSKTIFV